MRSGTYHVFFCYISRRGAGYMIFLNEEKDRYIPVMLPSWQADLAMAVMNKQVSPDNCGIYSSFLKMFSSFGFSVEGISILAEDSDGKKAMSAYLLTFMNNSVKSLMGNVAMPVSDAAMMSFLTGVPVLICDDHELKLSVGVTIPPDETMDEASARVIDEIETFEAGLAAAQPGHV